MLNGLNPPPEVKMMGTSIKFDDIDTALAEADELVQRLNSMLSEDGKETHQIEFEKRL